ncbi:lipopolysaccharide biosynthesis protein [Pseudoxanthomonas sangjuensis]|uniref:lipopolysaccharide biosynthesis protein n=1 Tax=Pseudoxanthomonas sangjuensis TaxID=1503750 RepID=UPI001391184B|nr:lipopolysaccharide biosynthesis protein [Pseudoxanthomonas sangjuensis]KAF1709680.1 lipopolysaccharide biosynthesis protein [Pseudoxanthomonas sangjuensis]
MPDWPAWILLHAAAAAAVTVWALRYALRRRLLDQPGERPSPDQAPPRGGGVALVVVLLLGCAWLIAAFPPARGQLSAFAAGLLLVAGIGWLDDHRPLAPWPRLVVQAVAGLLLAWAAWSAGGQIWLAVAAFVLAMGLVNVWNFMDGINGLATSQAMIAAAGLALVLPQPWNWLAAGLAAAAAGFLPFNFPRARIFLGDVGSGGLGYALAALLTAGLVVAPDAYGWLALPVCAFVVDAGFTLAWRMLKGERWWTPHVEHVYQRWARRHGHVTICTAYAVFSVGAVGLMLHGLRPGGAAGAWIPGFWYLGAALVWIWGHGKEHG